MGFVYFIRQVGSPYYKIGCTSGPVDDRKSSLQTGNPHELQEVLSIPTEREYVLESDLHRRYTAHRHRAEWFVFSEAQIERIREELGREFEIQSAFTGDQADPVRPLCWEQHHKPAAGAEDVRQPSGGGVFAGDQHLRRPGDGEPNFSGQNGVWQAG